MNARSVLKDVKALHSLQFTNKYDFICITETWLHSDIFDAELVSPEYNIFRKDRGSRGGGIAILTKKHINSYVIHDISTPLEALILSIKCSLGIGFIITIYLPPPTTLEDLNHLDTLLEEVYAQHTPSFLILLGDFNLPQYNKPTKLNAPSNSLNVEALSFITSENGLKQQVAFPTRDSNYLDLLFQT